MRRRLASAAFFVVVAALAGGCGVPQDDEPRMVSDRDVPFGLLETTTTTARIVTTAGN